MKKGQHKGRMRGVSTAAVNSPRNKPGAKPSAASDLPGWLASLLLVVLIMAVYFQTTSHGFFNIDDDQNIYQNPNVIDGLTPEGIAWAFGSFGVNRWAPLATICSQFNCTFFGLWPAGHHFVNVLIYAAGAVALWFALVEMTSLRARSFVLAAIFALHPLHVESVAWASGRNDLLCGLFACLTLFFYAKYARGPQSWPWYWAVAAAYACSLMSKPSTLMLPIALLALDGWPLRRLGSWRELGLRVLEKIPLLALAAGSAVLNVIGGKYPVEPWPALPLLERVSNSLFALVFYLGHIFLPLGLGTYPFSESGPAAWQGLGALALLVLISALAFFLRRRMPWLAAGWLWYGILLFPMIGLISISGQYFADRYPYLAQLGIEWAVVWTVAEVAAPWPQSWRKPLLAGASGLVLTLLFTGSYIQTTYWADNKTFWQHCIAAHPDNAVARMNYGVLLARDGKMDQAIQQYQAGLQSNPGYADGHVLLGEALLNQGRLPDAADQLQAAVRLRPYDTMAHLTLGIVMLRTGHMDEEVAQFRAAVATDPANDGLRNNLLAILGKQGKTMEEAQRLLPRP